MCIYNYHMSHAWHVTDAFWVALKKSVARDRERKRAVTVNEEQIRVICIDLITPSSTCPRLSLGVSEDRCSQRGQRSLRRSGTPQYEVCVCGPSLSPSGCPLRRRGRPVLSSRCPDSWCRGSRGPWGWSRTPSCGESRSTRPCLSLLWCWTSRWWRSNDGPTPWLATSTPEMSNKNNVNQHSQRAQILINIIYNYDCD